MADEFDINDFQRRMDGALTALTRDFSGLRTGRASTALLDSLRVDAYGSQMPLDQLGTVSAPEARMLTVQVWDAGLANAVEKCIRESELGLNPQKEGQVIRIPIPDLSEERRVEIKKIAAKYSEQGRVSVRNVRRDGMDQLKKLEKSGDLSQDDQRMYGDELQEMTDRLVKMIDEALAQKEAEIMQV